MPVTPGQECADAAYTKLPRPDLGKMGTLPGARA